MPILAGTASGLVDVESGDVVDLGGHEVSAVDGGWALLDRRMVTRRPQGAPRAAPEGGLALTCVAAAPDDPTGTALVGTAEAHLFRAGTDLEPLESFERAEGRDRWYTPWGGPPDVRSISTGPGGTILVNVHVGGILRSVDAGRSWAVTIDIDTDVHQVLALDDGRAVAACAEGLATSDDDGATWTVVDDGLHATYARSVAVAGDTVLLGVSTGPDGARPAVYRRPLGGAGALERCRAGLPDQLQGNVDTFRLVGGPGGTAAFCTPTGDLYVSADEGASWELAASDLPAVRCLVLD